MHRSDHRVLYRTGRFVARIVQAIAHPCGQQGSTLLRSGARQRRKNVSSVKYKLPGRHDGNINIIDLTLDDLQGEEGGGGAGSTAKI